MCSLKQFSSDFAAAGLSDNSKDSARFTTIRRHFPHNFVCGAGNNRPLLCIYVLARLLHVCELLNTVEDCGVCAVGCDVIDSFVSLMNKVLTAANGAHRIANTSEGYSDPWREFRGRGFVKCSFQHSSDP